MREKTFIQHLEEQLRHQIRAEIEIEYATNTQAPLTPVAEAPIDLLAAKAGSFESWMAGNVAKTFFKSNKTAGDVYGRPRVRPSAAARPEPIRYRKLTIEECLAANLLSRYSGIDLDTDFTKTNLKQAWRKAALLTHPDRVEIENDPAALERATVLFRELTSAYEILKAV